MSRPRTTTGLSALCRSLTEDMQIVILTDESKKLRTTIDTRKERGQIPEAITYKAVQVIDGDKVKRGLLIKVAGAAATQ